MIFSKPTFVSLSPNTEREDVLLALKMLFSFGKERSKKTEEVERKLAEYLDVKNLVTFNSGRSAFLEILKAFEIQKGDEILIQSFTCNAVANPILKMKAKPVFVEIDNTLNIDPFDLEKKITSKSKAVVLQHTFGWPAKIDEVKKICKENNLFLIEDVAHSLGSKYKGKLCGTLGDASFFSFGRDKIISSVFGGAAFVKDEERFKKIKDSWQNLPFPSKIWTLQQLLHPTLTNYVIIPSYALGQYFGKIVMGFFHKTLFLSKSVYKKEKKGIMVNFFPKKMPSALSSLLLKQIEKLERFNNHRRKISKIYYDNLSRDSFEPVFPEKDHERISTFMKYPVLAKSETNDILKKMRKKGIYLNDGWRKSPVMPPDTVLKNVSYVLKSCPKAESVAERIINLPTHINISESKAKKIIKLLNSC